MINHTEAYHAAETLINYCKERFTGSERDCKDCIFHHRRCVLYALFGQFGEGASQIAEEIVKENYHAKRNDNPQDDN